MNKDGFERQEISWLKNVELGRGYPAKILQGEDGSLALYYEVPGKSLLAGKLCIEENGRAKVVEIPDWNQANDDGEYYTPDMAAYLGDNKIAWAAQDKLMIYDVKAKKKIEEIDYTGSSEYHLTAGYGMIASIDGNMENTKGAPQVDLFEEGSIASPRKSIALSEKENSKSAMYINEKQDVILADAAGIHVLEQGGSIWETVVDGALNQMYAPEYHCFGVTQAKDNTYYVLYQVASGQMRGSDVLYAMMRYTMDEAMPAVPEKTLTVYTLQEQDMLRNAALVLQRRHPEIKVDIVVGFDLEQSDEQAAQVRRECIKALHTQLLNQKGPDVIVMDGLPQESYIEKGVLMDLSDLIEPMIEKKELLENIMTPYKRSGAYYVIPVIYRLPMIITKPEAASYLHSLTEMAEYTKKNGEKSIFAPITARDLLEEFLPIYWNSIVEQGSVNEEKLRKFLEQINAVYVDSGKTEAYPEEGGKPHIFDLPKVCQMHLQSVKGFFDLILQFGVMNEVKGTYNILNHAYLPSCQIGINAYSTQADAAKELLTILLSKELQDKLAGDGFSVNRESLNEVLGIDGEDYAFCCSLEGEDGTSRFAAFSWPEKNMLKEIIDRCSNADHCAVMDPELYEIVLSESKDYFLGTKNSQQTTQAIIHIMKLYESERKQ